MANVAISACTGGSLITVDFTGSTPIDGQVYYLTFTGSTSDTCYTVGGEPDPTAVDTVLTSSLFASCSECNGNVVLRNCTTGEEVVAPRKTTLIGDIVSATGDTTDCYEVISYTSETSRDGISFNYEDCLECYQNEFTSVVFSSCTDNNESVILTASTASLTFVPDPSSTYYLTLSGASLQYVGCFNFVRFTNASNQYQITSNEEYTSCYNCRVPNIPTSAGTIYYSCIICEGAATTINPPHPVYSNQYGQDVVQLNAVQLGGTYGLYN